MIVFSGDDLTMEIAMHVRIKVSRLYSRTDGIAVADVVFTGEPMVLVPTDYLHTILWCQVWCGH